jgi:hypothetical protein
MSKKRQIKDQGLKPGFAGSFNCIPHTAGYSVFLCMQSEPHFRTPLPLKTSSGNCPYFDLRQVITRCGMAANTIPAGWLDKAHFSVHESRP